MSDPLGTPATTAANAATTAASAGLEGDGISLDEAANRLHLSERSVRRLIKAGNLAAQKQASPRGEVWRVYLNGSTSAAPADPGTETGSNPGKAATTAADPGTETAEKRSEPPTAASPESRPDVLKALEIIDELRRDNQKLVDTTTQLAGQ